MNKKRKSTDAAQHGINAGRALAQELVDKYGPRNPDALILSHSGAISAFVRSIAQLYGVDAASAMLDQASDISKRLLLEKFPPNLH